MASIFEMARGNNAAQRRGEAFAKRLAHGDATTRADEITRDLTEGAVPGREEDKKRGATSLGKIAKRTVGPQVGPHRGEGKRS